MGQGPVRTAGGFRDIFFISARMVTGGMADSDASDSPLDAIAGAAGPSAADAFELLANETRLAILLALWEAYEPFTPGGGLSFSELRDRVGVRDSGQFNYHLGKLDGHFVGSSDEGYKLRPAGEKVTRAVIGSTEPESHDIDDAPLDVDCVRCGAATRISYRNGRLLQRCTECGGNFAESDALPPGTLHIWRLEPAGLSGRTPEEVYAAAASGMFHQLFAVIDDVCPECFGRLETGVEWCDAHDPADDGVCPVCGHADEILIQKRCVVCKFTAAAAPTDLVTPHPAVVAFYYDHGIEVQYGLDLAGVTRLIELEGNHEQTIEATDPLRVRVTVRYEGDEISLRFDEAGRVIDVID